MSHLHRLRAAQLAIACDKDTCHTCEPVLPDSQAEDQEGGKVVTGKTGAPAVTTSAAAAARTPRAKRAKAKKRAKRG